MPSACNYFLVRLHRGRAADVKKFMLERHGILIRDASNFRGLDAAYFRLAVQEEEQNQSLIRGLKEWISGQ
jgi:threonine-phosphate decarboxylase